LLTEFGLPRELPIYCYNDITLRFSGSATPLAAFWDRNLNRGYKMGEMPGEWSRFWHLADQEYLQGGGWVCLDADRFRGGARARRAGSTGGGWKRAVG
jgi:hypothetical protein